MFMLTHKQVSDFHWLTHSVSFSYPHGLMLMAISQHPLTRGPHILLVAQSRPLMWLKDAVVFCALVSLHGGFTYQDDALSAFRVCHRGPPRAMKKEAAKLILGIKCRQTWARSNLVRKPVHSAHTSRIANNLHKRKTECTCKKIIIGWAQPVCVLRKAIQAL